MIEQTDPQKLFSILNNFTSKDKLQKLMAKAEGLYLMNSFKIKPMSTQQAIQLYEHLNKKYKTEQLKINQNQWYKNQRRLFLWYLICFSEKNKVPIEHIKENEWVAMGKSFFSKNAIFLKFQGLTIFKNIKKHKWTKEEEKQLSSLVQQLGTNSWNEISKVMFLQKEGCQFISSKQCRQRWYNHTNNKLNKDPWTPQQDINILRLSAEKGKRWSQIARMLGTNRTEHMVKNRYVSIINKTRLSEQQHQEQLIEKAIQRISLNQKVAQQVPKQTNRSPRLEKISKQKSQLSIKNHIRGVCSFSFNSLLQEQEEDQEQTEKKQCTTTKQLNIFINSLIRQAPEQPSQRLPTPQQHINEPLLFSITPSTIKPSLISPLPFQAGFDTYFLEFEKRRKQDGPTSPFSFSFNPPSMMAIPSPFPLPENMKRSASLCSPVGISDLSIDLSQMMNKKESKQQ